jgi:hypothetical protein
MISITKSTSISGVTLMYGTALEPPPELPIAMSLLL